MGDKKKRYNDLHKQYLDVHGPEFDANDMEQASISYAYNTCGIEGNTITLGETESIVVADKVIPGRSLTEHLEIKDAHNAFKKMFSFISEGYEMSERLAMTFHKLNTRSWLDPKYSGKYKAITNRIGGRSTPYPEKARQMFKKLFEDVEDIEDTFDRAAVLHLKTVIIHPWQDGNGRTARMMMNYELLKESHGHLQISKNEKDTYFKAIRNAIDTRSDEPFKEFLYDVAIRTYQNKIQLLSQKKNDKPENSIWDANPPVRIY